MPNYRVIGIDIETGMDTELVIDAQTAGNARVKAKLKGVEVTEVIDPFAVAPLAAPMPQAAPQYHEQPRQVRPVVIEQTSKKWKGAQLVCAAVAIGSMLFVAVGAASESGAIVALGVLGVLGGLVAFLIARIGAWWDHG